jgi:hypothetical protein
MSISFSFASITVKYWYDNQLLNTGKQREAEKLKYICTYLSDDPIYHTCPQKSLPLSTELQE